VNLESGYVYQSSDFNENTHSCWLEAENQNISKIFSVSYFIFNMFLILILAYQKVQKCISGLQGYQELPLFW
jgi:hypothetical protein